MRDPYRLLPIALLALVAFALFPGCGSDSVGPDDTLEGGTARIDGVMRGIQDLEFTAEEGPDSPGPLHIRVRNISYDDSLGALVADFVLVNGSDRDLPEPVTLTFLALFPEGVTVLNADNGETGPGASFDFAFANEDGVWTPGEETLPRSVQFGVSSGVSIGFVTRVDMGMSSEGGSIGGLVWHDENGDGIVDDDEGGIEGATIQLHHDEGQSEATTDSEGHYRFDGLPAGQYTVSKVVTDLLEPTTPTEIGVLLVETDEGVSDFLVANFGCKAGDDSTETPDLEEGDWVNVVGDYVGEDNKVVARGVGVARDDDDDDDDESRRPRKAEIRGPITSVDLENHVLGIMGADVAFPMADGRLDPPDGCAECFEDLEEGDRVRTLIHTPLPESPDDPLVGYWLRCWNGNPEKLKGRVQEVLRDEDGVVTGFVVLRIAVEVTNDTEWGDDDPFDD